MRLYETFRGNYSRNLPEGLSSRRCRLAFQNSAAAFSGMLLGSLLFSRNFAYRTCEREIQAHDIMRITLLPLVLFALVAGPAFARAQTPGEDNCSTGGTVISGLGSFGFDNSNATTGVEGQNESICYQFGSSAINNDVWFAWTAPTTSTFIVETCLLTTIDTKIAAYPTNLAGPCPVGGSVLDCNDDSCALQSQITFQGTAGSSYLLQIGTFPGATGGSGTFNISTSAPSNDDCNNPATITGLGTFPFDGQSATTGLPGQSETLCYTFGTSAVNDDVWFLWNSTFTGMAEVTTCGLTSDDTKIAVYPVGAVGACPQVGSALACNDNACGSQSSISFAALGGTLYAIQIGRSPLAGGSATSPGSFKITQAQPTFGQNYGVGYSGDYKGPLHGQLDVNGNTIYESDLVRPAGGLPQLGGASGPEILISGAQLGLTPACTNPGPGTPCKVEVDAYSRGRDGPLKPVVGEGGHLFFSVDEWAKGIQSVMIDSNGNPFIAEPSVRTEGAGGAREASADIFTMIPDLLPGPIAPPQQGQPRGNLAVLDGDGRRSSSGHQYPGVGLIEPNPPSPGADNVGSNSDVLNLSRLDSIGEGSISASNPVFFSLDGDLIDPLEQIQGTDSAGAHGQAPGDILVATGTQTSVYATALQLGIAGDIGDPQNDIDALVLWDNGDNIYQAARYPYQWAEDNDGDGIMDADMLLFSVRRGSPIIGVLDSQFGLPIEPGDLLMPPVDSSGLSLLAGPGAPGVFVAAEAMGLRTARGGASEADDLNSADVGDDAFYDCNENGIDDAIDCSSASSDDNNYNGIPDECEDIVEFCSGQTFASALICQCPCGNCDSTSTGVVGCANGAQLPDLVGAGLTASGSTSVSESPPTFKLIGGSLVTNQPGLYFQGNNAVNSGSGNTFGDGLRCAGGSVIRLQVRAANSSGVSETNIDLIAKGGITSGAVKHYQLWYRDPASTICGTSFNLTNGVKVTFGP